MYFLNLLQSGPLVAFGFLLAIVIAITIHEFAHAWAANKLGDDTPYLMGRVTLNPAAHLDPIGSILFLIAGFGWGKPVLYNPMRLARRVDELLIALAGPASNLILAFILNVVIFVMNRVAPGINTELIQLASYINVILAAFNMLPIPPLDGSAILAYFWPHYRSIMGSQIGLIVLLLFIFLPGPGGTNLLGAVIIPIQQLFTLITRLGGVLPV